MPWRDDQLHHRGGRIGDLQQPAAVEEEGEGVSLEWREGIRDRCDPDHAQSAGFWSSRSGRAGWPATTVSGATSAVTTELAPTTAPRPMRTSGMTTTPAPIQASSSIVTGPLDTGANGPDARIVGVGRGHERDARPDADAIADDDVVAVGEFLDDDDAVGDVDALADAEAAPAKQREPPGREEGVSWPSA